MTFAINSETSPASALAIGHEIAALNILMATTARCSLTPMMGSMPHGIHHVFGLSSPVQILDVVMCGVSIVMTAFVFRARTWRTKSLQHNPMNQAIVLLSVAHQIHMAVPRITCILRHDVTLPVADKSRWMSLVGREFRNSPPPVVNCINDCRSPVPFHPFDNRFGLILVAGVPFGPRVHFTVGV